MKKWWTIAAALVAACIEADPLPSPGAPREDSVFVSSAAPLTEGTQQPEAVALVGLPGAVEDTGAVIVRQRRGILPVVEVVVAASDEGAFATTLDAFADDEITLVFRSADNRFSKPIAVKVPGRFTTRSADAGMATGGAGAPPPTENPPDPQNDNDSFRACTSPCFTAGIPDATSGVTVTGSGLQPAIEVLVAVPARASTARATVDAGGNFSARVRANSGDTLFVFTRDPATQSTSPAASLVVPTPP